MSTEQTQLNSACRCMAVMASQELHYPAIQRMLERCIWHGNSYLEVMI